MRIAGVGLGTRLIVYHSMQIWICKFIDLNVTDGKEINTAIQKSEENTIYTDHDI